MFTLIQEKLKIASISILGLDIEFAIFIEIPEREPLGCVGRRIRDGRSKRSIPSPVENEHCTRIRIQHGQVSEAIAIEVAVTKIVRLPGKVRIPALGELALAIAEKDRHRVGERIPKRDVGVAIIIEIGGKHGERDDVLSDRRRRKE